MDEPTRQRALAIAGVTGLMIVALTMLIMVASAIDGDEETEVATPAATSTPQPTPTAKPKPTPVPLTPDQREARRTAAELVESKGFEVVRLRDYDPRRKLRVLIGESGGTRMAFFFVDDLYIGNDRTTTSPELKVKRAGNLQVTLTYEDGNDVRFKWDGTSLVPQDPLPG